MRAACDHEARSRGLRVSAQATPAKASLTRRSPGAGTVNGFWASAADVTKSSAAARGSRVRPPLEVLGIQLVERPHEIGVVVAIERAERAGDQVGIREMLTHELEVTTLGPRRELGPLGGGTAGKGATCLAGLVALSEPGHHRLVGPSTRLDARRERLIGRTAGAGRPRDRIEHGIDDDMAHAVGEHRGVARPEVTPIGHAVVVEPRVPDCLPDEVHIAGGVGGRHVRDDGGRVIRARLPEPLRLTPTAARATRPRGIRATDFPSRSAGTAGVQGSHRLHELPLFS